jgi:hypothetical protein
MFYILLELYARLNYIVLYEARTFNSYIHIELPLLRRPPPLPLPSYLDVAATGHRTLCLPRRSSQPQPGKAPSLLDTLTMFWHNSEED